jgi:hypothetical protein
VRASGFRTISSMNLAPGRYQLRIGVTESNTSRAGSVLLDVDVPDFVKEPFSISHIALTSPTSTFAPTQRPGNKDPLAKLLPGPLTSYREFPQGDEIAVFAEVYETNVKVPHKVEIALTMKAEGGQTVFQTREDRDSAELAGAAGGHGFTARIPLRDIAPGNYVLRVEAQSRLADRPMAARETVVRVAPAPAAASPAAQSGGAAKPAPGGTIAMTTLNSDQMSGIGREQQAVARTEAEFQALWAKHAVGRPAPAVDFSKHMVIGVFLGSRPSAGFQVQITSVRRDGNVLVVEWAERRPTAPSHIITVPMHTGEVRFEKVQVQGPAA